MNDSFTEIWNSIIEELADSYRPGTFDFLVKHRPRLYREILQAEETFNRDWKKKWIVAFKEDIKHWQDLIKHGIEQFKKEEMRLPRQSAKNPQRQSPSQKETEPEAPRPKTFWDVFQEMRDKEAK